MKIKRFLRVELTKIDEKKGVKIASIGKAHKFLVFMYKGTTQVSVSISFSSEIVVKIAANEAGKLTFIEFKFAHVGSFAIYILKTK